MIVGCHSVLAPSRDSALTTLIDTPLSNNSSGSTHRRPQRSLAGRAPQPSCALAGTGTLVRVHDQQRCRNLPRCSSGPRASRAWSHLRRQLACWRRVVSAEPRAITSAAVESDTVARSGDGVAALRIAAPVGLCKCYMGMVAAAWWPHRLHPRRLLPHPRRPPPRRRHLAPNRPCLRPFGCKAPPAR